MPPKLASTNAQEDRRAAPNRLEALESDISELRRTIAAMDEGHRRSILTLEESSRAQEDHNSHQLAISNNPQRTSGILGFTGYYRRFIIGYGTRQLKRDAFHWNSDAEAAFQQLKNALISAPVLALPDFSLPFEVEADASGHGLGVVLMQQRWPVAFYSKDYPLQGVSDLSTSTS
ncbi:unnamed protein product [Spirodela intermedia]|uniref:Reverse transcriptase/retrotransposon-derived protein RNase H-like domain-containing protein n=1 Tax=Spirodela intermedia TaxID=51605 RepID=A0A7I8I858_SPIIN|nr:unnamed protein product [Spirodela intermedia]CAA6653668.1 unnamed protein product [Spirodela intermedia]